MDFAVETFADLGKNCKRFLPLKYQRFWAHLHNNHLKLSLRSISDVTIRVSRYLNKAY